MPDPITLTAIGLYACNQAVGFAVNVASDLSIGQWRSKNAYTNHDIPRTVREAWKQAITSVFNQYAQEHKAGLSDADQMAIKTATKDLAAGEFADAMFLGIEDALPATALDLSGNPLPAVTSDEQLVEAGRQLITALRDHARTKPLLSKVPESFYEHCAEHLVCAMSYFYVEIAIKDDEKACKQIMYRIAQDSWVLMNLMREGIERIEKGVGENLELARGLDESTLEIKQDTGEIKELLKQILSTGGTGGQATAEMKEKEERDLAAGLVLLADRAESGDELAKRAIEDCDPKEATLALIAERNRVDEAKTAAIARVQEHELTLDRAIAVSAIRTGDLDDAVDALGRIIRLVPIDFDALTKLGRIALTRGEHDKAEELYDAVLGEKPDDEHRSKALNGLGLIEMSRRNIDNAERHLQDAYAIHKQLGYREGMASNLGNLGLIMQFRQDLDAAQSYHNHALAINKDIGRKEGMASNLGNIGLIEQIRGNLTGAVEYLTDAFSINIELGHKEGVARNHANLGLIEQARGNGVEAREHLAQARDLLSEIGMVNELEMVQAWLNDLE